MATAEEIKIANKVIAEEKAKAKAEAEAIIDAKHADNQKKAGYAIVFLIALLGGILVKEGVLPISVAVAG